MDDHHVTVCLKKEIISVLLWSVCSWKFDSTFPHYVNSYKHFLCLLSNSLVGSQTLWIPGLAKTGHHTIPDNKKPCMKTTWKAFFPCNEFVWQTLFPYIFLKLAFYLCFVVNISAINFLKWENQQNGNKWQL